jgi:hypothetical protein
MGAMVSAIYSFLKSSIIIIIVVVTTTVIIPVDLTPFFNTFHKCAVLCSIPLLALYLQH